MLGITPAAAIRASSPSELAIFAPSVPGRALRLDGKRNDLSSRLDEAERRQFASSLAGLIPFGYDVADYFRSRPGATSSLRVQNQSRPFIKTDLGLFVTLESS